LEVSLCLAKKIWRTKIRYWLALRQSESEKSELTSESRGENQGLIVRYEANLNLYQSSLDSW